MNASLQDEELRARAMAAGARCGVCPLNTHRPVFADPGAGKGRVKLVILGEGPGRYEEVVGRAFVGPSGKCLDAQLEKAGLQRQEAWISNAAICNGSAESDAVKQRATACCAPRLQKELSELDPEKKLPVLTLGKFAAYALLGIRKIQAHRGFVWRAPEIPAARLRAAQRSREKANAPVTIERTEDRIALLTAMTSYAGRVIIPSIHPAFVLRSDTWAPLLRLDVKRAVAISRGEPYELLDEGAFQVVNDVDIRRVRRLLTRLGPVVSIDIESKPSKADIAAGKKYPDPLTCQILSVQLSDARPDVPKEEWNTFVLYPWRKLYAPLLTEVFKARTATGHNIHAFDDLALSRFDVKLPKKECSLIAHHTFASHLPQSLGHVASVFVPFCGPWKSNHQAGGALAERGMSPWEAGGSELTAYGAADVRIQGYAWGAMQPALEQERKVYERDLAVAEHLCQEMQRTGLAVDVPRRKELSQHLQHRAAALLGELRRMSGNREFDPKKPDDVRAVLFGRFKAPVFKLTATGYRSTGAEVLEALRGGSTDYGRFSDLLLRYRSTTKADATFMRAPLGRDGRVHSSWRAFGTQSGRPASRNPNLLNVPRFAAVQCKKCYKVFPDDVERCPLCKGAVRFAFDQQIRSIYIAPPGKVWVYFDLKQAEMWAAAQQSADEAFIASCESGDVHAGNAAVLFPEVAAQALRAGPAGSKEYKTFWKDGPGKPYRDIAKNAGFAVCYGAEAETVFKYLRSQGFPVSLDQVQRMLDRMKATYRQYYRWVADNFEAVKRCGYTRTTLLGRKRWFGWVAPSPNEVMNTPIQSFVSDVMGERLLELRERRDADRALRGRAPLIGYHYDAGIYEVPEKVADRMSALVKDVWQRPIVLPNGRSWVQPIDQKTGTRWSTL